MGRQKIWKVAGGACGIGMKLKPLHQHCSARHAYLKLHHNLFLTIIIHLNIIHIYIYTILVFFLFWPGSPCGALNSVKIRVWVTTFSMCKWRLLINWCVCVCWGGVHICNMFQDIFDFSSSSPFFFFSFFWLQ